MGNCERELYAPPPGCGQGFEFWKDVEAHWGPIIRTLAAVEAFRAGLGPGCFRELNDQLTITLGHCKIEFWKVCDFDRLIRICPFDPAWDAFDWKQQVVSERLQALEVQVKELQAKLPTK